MHTEAPPNDEPRPQRRQVVEGSGGVAGACTPLDPVAQADVVVALDADRVGLLSPGQRVRPASRPGLHPEGGGQPGWSF